jgi:hypothetical protein
MNKGKRSREVLQNELFIQIGRGMIPGDAGSGEQFFPDHRRMFLKRIGYGWSGCESRLTQDLILNASVHTDEGVLHKNASDALSRVQIFRKNPRRSALEG